MADETLTPGETAAIAEDLSVDAKFIQERESSIEGLTALLADLKAKAQEIEAHERQRASTPLALKLEIVSCEYCSVIVPANKTIPEFRFDTVPCIFGKERPDQDCRDCSHVRYIPYGANLPHHEKRYASHGMVIPIQDEDEADAIATALSKMSAKPLRRVQFEIQAAERALELALTQREDAKAREVERHQRGEL